MQVATIRTPATAAQMLGALQWALGGNAPQIAVAMIAAQSAVETASWHAMNNWNAGNITPTASQAASGQWMDQGIHGMRYIAYGSLLAGAAGMVAFLRSRGLLPFAFAGNLAGYSAQLETVGYLGRIGQTDPTGHTVSQADYDAYQRAMGQLIPKLLATTPAVVAPSSGSSFGPWLFAAALFGGGALIYREGRT
jgi:hypothetical protein